MAILREVLSQASRQLRNAGVTETPFLDALVLSAKVLGSTKERALASLQDDLNHEQERELFSLAARRASGEPSAYIIGEQEFFGYPFAVSPAVLIPRPETELLVEQVLLAAGRRPGSPRILDLCTGSGCIGISVKLELPGAEVTCSDVSSAALEVCRQNACRLNAEVAVLQGNLLDRLDGPFDIIVTNPPYLTFPEMKDESLISRGEPETALFGGHDGLDLIREIVRDGFDKLSQKGYLIIESSISQTAVIRDMMISRGFDEAEIIPDLTGRARVVKGRRTKV